MNLLNFALSGLAGGLSGSLTAVTGSPAATLLATRPAASANVASTVPTRDSAIPDLSELSSSVNLLQQAATSQTADSSLDPQLTVPPLPTMPAPKPAVAAPTDDHGQSNVVFSDADGDASLIH